MSPKTKITMDDSPNITKAKEYILKLSKRCVASMRNKDYSNLSKLPWKVMTFVNAMNWRMKECADAALLLLESDLTHPALMLVRSSMENAAITIRLSDIVKDAVERKKIIGDDDSLMKLLFGNSYHKDTPFINNDDDRLKAERIGKLVKRAEELYSVLP